MDGLHVGTHGCMHWGSIMRVIKGAAATLFGFGFAWSAQVCSLSFQACPGSFAGVIDVPKDVIWLDPKIPVCDEAVQVSKSNSPPPSIVFIIDNSGSMIHTDPQEQRFAVTTELLDTLFDKTPNAEVGLVIFSRRLSFDTRDNPYFKPAYPGDTSQHDAYFPLTTLSFRFPNGKLGVDSLKEMLRNNDGNLVHATTYPNSRPNSDPAVHGPLDVRNGTDISLGFDAARQAMLASNNKSPDNRFFVFLSDGNPAALDDTRKGKEYDFVAGLKTPTTFTVFFRDNKQDATDSIQKMTTDIQHNGYSPISNPKSRYYEAQLANGGLLAPLLFDNVLSTILTNLPATPKSAVLSHDGQSVPNSGLDGRDFTFPKRIPLDPDQTVINITYTYTYTDSAGKLGSKDFPYTLTVRRSNVGSPPDSATASCYDQADIKLYDNHGRPLSVVTADDDSLEARLTLPGGETCNGCQVVVTPSKSADRENVAVNPGAGYYSGDFKRATSATPIPQNGTLENVPGDSIVVTYVNPDNPLDVVRKSFPYSDVRTTLATDIDGPLVHPREDAAQDGNRWILVGNAPLNVETAMKDGCCGFLPSSDPSVNPGAAPSDTVPYLGIRIQASRAFKADVRIYTNHGLFVDKFNFTVPQSEFGKLPASSNGSVRVLRLLWKNRAQDGSRVGTGAYIVKYTVTLNPIPGIADDKRVTSDVRIVGVLRSP